MQTHVENLNAVRRDRPAPVGDGDITIGLCVPIYRDVDAEHYMQMMAFASEFPIWAPANWRLKMTPCVGSPVDANRNSLMIAALSSVATVAPDGRNTFDFGHLTGRRADIVLGCDSDVAVTPQNALILLSQLIMAPTDVAMIGVPLPCRDKGVRINVRLLDGAKNAPWVDGQLHEVEGVGTGLFALRTDAIHDGEDAAPTGKVGWPWFSFLHPGPAAAKDPKAARAVGGEDYRFCAALRAAGRRVMVLGLDSEHCYSSPHSARDEIVREYKLAQAEEVLADAAQFQAYMDENRKIVDQAAKVLEWFQKQKDGGATK